VTDDQMSTRTTRRAGRGSRRLRRQLVGVLVGTALVSLLIVGTLNSVAAWSLLTDGSRERLVSVAETRANTIDRVIDRLLSRTSATAADLSVVDALNEFQLAFDALDNQTLDEQQSAELDEFYQDRVIDPLAGVGIDVTLGTAQPATEAGRYLQYHYSIRSNAQDPEAAGADDDSIYSSVTDRLDPYFVSIASDPVIDNVMLIGPSGDVIYTTENGIDLGTNLNTGPYSDTLLARAVLDRLPRARAGSAIIADWQIYVANRGRPTLFAVASAKSDTRVAGTLVFSISIDALNAITTANGDWESIGLGGGESYVVGPDQVLFSESRAWIEDPESYLDSIDDPEMAGLVEAFGSPVGLQPVDTEAVRVAINGDTFVGATKNYLGKRTYAYATQISVGGSKWVVVAEQPIGEIRAPLFSYLIRLGIALAVVLPLAGLVGYWFAQRLTRAIPPVVEMASAIAGGERDVDAPDLGANEFGDLARRLEQMASELGEQEAALETEFTQRRALLLSVLPPRLVLGQGEIGGTGEAIDTATVISIDVSIATPIDDEVEASELLQRFGEAAEQAATILEIERVRSAADRLLFLAGVSHDHDGADTAIGFVTELGVLVNEIAESDDEALQLHIGMSTGPVATGVLERGRLTFTVWGEPVRRAQAIGALSTSNQILVDESTALALTDQGRVGPASDIIALDGQPMTLFTPSAVR